jgi:Lon protease-like protein
MSVMVMNQTNQAAGKADSVSQPVSQSVSQSARNRIMELPIFPLKNVVLFPGMVLPLHIFEMRYREMINRCVAERLPFGVVLIDEGQEVGVPARPHTVGAAARIARVERLDDGRMNITAVGTQRFRILEVHTTQSYLTATVSHFPVVNGGTQLAADLSQRVRPQVLEYVTLLSKAANVNLTLDRLPEDPLTLAMLVAISLQISVKDKQRLLEAAGVPEMLALEGRLLTRELLLLQYMIDTREDVETLNRGPSGYIFPN